MTIKKGGLNPSSSSAGYPSDKVKVAVRVRPFNRREANTCQAANVAGETVYLVHPNEGKPPKPFSFDFCFGPLNAPGNSQILDNSMDSVASAASVECQNAQQEEVFQRVGMDVVENAFLGFNTCVFAYGQTGSGKSYTMMGTAEEPGIIPRLCTELFERATRETNDASQFKVEISFYEVYNERIRDLLGKQCQKRPSLRVREHSLFGPMVEGLCVFMVNNYEQVKRLISEGNSVRTTAATLMNDESSRSHSVFTIKLTQTISDADDKTFTGEKVSKISLVDLAGSERAQKTGATGKRLEEGGNINKSLTALGKVISALAAESTNQKGRANGTNFIPYRDSTLTWLLKENLGGNSRTTMIATISPSSYNYEESLSTLRFADRAKRIQTHAVVNEDPNAKIIRELREEVEQLRLLNKSHAQQHEAFQMAMEQIAQRHQEEKKMALEQQYEQFSQYIRELTQSLQTPSACSTPMTSFGGGNSSIASWGMSPSPSISNGLQSRTVGTAGSIRDLNNNANGGGIGNSKKKFLEWAHQREEMFTRRLRLLRLAIQRAHALATEANSLVTLLTTNSHWDGKKSPAGMGRPNFSIGLQIPARNLRPSKLALEMAEGEEEEEDEEGRGCICEPIILLKWEEDGGRRKRRRKKRGNEWGRMMMEWTKGEQQLTMEQMECKLTELRTAISLSNANGPSKGITQEEEEDDEMNGNPKDNLFPIFGTLLARREKHQLIGVANVFLGMLFHGNWEEEEDKMSPSIDIASVLIINQQGEICGRLHVQVKRLAICWPTESSDDSTESIEELDLLQMNMANGNRSQNIRPERLLGRTVQCRVDIKKATNLPVEQANFVFCQYSFFEKEQIVVPTRQESSSTTNGHGSGTQQTVHFESPNDFEFVCTRPFLDYVEEDALSIEVWGHRMPENEEDEEEEEEMEKKEEEGEEAKEWTNPEEFDGEWEELEEIGEEDSDDEEEEEEDIAELAERKKKSLQERWQEVTKRIELWLQILEMDAQGEMVPVEVEQNGNEATGGIYRLRQGQQRRIRIAIRNMGNLEEGMEGTMPLCLEDIHSIKIGSVVIAQEEEEEEKGRGGLGLDSYQELDLARLKAQWEDVLAKRAEYLQTQIHQMTSSSNGQLREGRGRGRRRRGTLEEERERALLMNWVELVEERNAISIPTCGIPGAPLELKMPDGFERHCPIIFLQQGRNPYEGKEEDEEFNAVEMEAAGWNNYLPNEDEESGQIGLTIVRKETNDNELNCDCSWDSSLHGQLELNRPSKGGKRIYLIVKVLIRITQPCCIDLLLRKRICIRLVSPFPSSSTTSRWPSLPWSSDRRASQQNCLIGGQLTGTGLFIDLISGIPWSTLDLENRGILAKLAVRHVTTGQNVLMPGKLVKDKDEEMTSSTENTSPEQMDELTESNYLSEYVTKTIQAVEWLIKMDRLRQEEAVNRAFARQRRIQMKMGASNCVGGGGGMKRTISLPTTMNNYLMTSSVSFHAKFETIEDGREDSSSSSMEGTPKKNGILHNNNKMSLHPSQSHTEGFHPHPNTNNNHHKAITMGGGLANSPNSSGYASMVNSVASPGEIRLAGIQEENQIQNDINQMNTNENHNGEEFKAEADGACKSNNLTQQTTGNAFSPNSQFMPNVHALHLATAPSHCSPPSPPSPQFTKTTAGGVQNNDEEAEEATTNMFPALPLSANEEGSGGISSPIPEAFPFGEDEVADGILHSTSPQCCCENRLFSPPSPGPPPMPPVLPASQRKLLFFQNTINSASFPSPSTMAPSHFLLQRDAAIIPPGNNEKRGTEQPRNEADNNNEEVAGNGHRQLLATTGNLQRGTTTRRQHSTTSATAAAKSMTTVEHSPSSTPSASASSPFHFGASNNFHLPNLSSNSRNPKLASSMAATRSARRRPDFFPN